MAIAGASDTLAEIQQRRAVWLWILLAFFCFRVGAQLVQSIFETPYLPPFSAWQSGLLPYGLLVASQFVIIWIYARTALAFQRAQIQARSGPGRFLLIFGSLYVLAMGVRYVLRMSWYPQERWAGGCLPIFFHLILASFLLIWGTYHWHYRQQASSSRI